MVMQPGGMRRACALLLALVSLGGCKEIASRSNPEDPGSTAYAGAGAIGSWQTSSVSLPAVRSSHVTLTTGGYLYVIGGYSYGLRDDVLYAPIWGGDAPSEWLTTSDLPAPLNGHACAVYDGRLYVTGGSNLEGPRSEVLFASAEWNGPVEPWQTTSALPEPRYSHTCVAGDGYLYTLGGEDSTGQALNDVLYAQLLEDGSVLPWQATTAFSTARALHASVVYGSFVYVIGGYGAEASVLADVQFASMNADGPIGDWQVTTSLPAGQWAHTAEASSGFLYVIGGAESGVYGESKAVLYAPINSNGTLGDWHEAAPLPTGRSSHGSALWAGRLYVIGGTFEGEDLSDVLVAAILG